MVIAAVVVAVPGCVMSPTEAKMVSMTEEAAEAESVEASALTVLPLEGDAEVS